MSALGIVGAGRPRAAAAHVVRSGRGAGHACQDRMHRVAVRGPQGVIRDCLILWECHAGKVGVRMEDAFFQATGEAVLTVRTRAGRAVSGWNLCQTKSVCGQ